MNREILFRGKRIDNGEWAEGYIYEHEAPLVCFSNDQKEDSKWYIVQTAFADWNMPRNVEMIRVCSDTVGQYIGKADINGKKIFEGDIIRQPYSKYQSFDIIGAVRFNKAAQFVVDHVWTAEQNEWKKGKKKGYAITSDCEIVGNIYDNPELLEAHNDQ